LAQQALHAAVAEASSWPLPGEMVEVLAGLEDPHEELPGDRLLRLELRTAKSGRSVSP
jgi:hypothetical protein